MPSLTKMIGKPNLPSLILWLALYLEVYDGYKFIIIKFPSGSTDTVAMCLHGSTDPVTAALHIVIGGRLDVDVVSIHSEEKLERFAMTMLSYGYFGDLMKHSER